MKEPLFSSLTTLHKEVELALSWLIHLRLNEILYEHVNVALYLEVLV